jgi:heme-degrading monooxygenase HmoA
MHATVRIYEGVQNPSEVIEQVTATFLPLMKEIPGFVDYYFVDVGDSGGRMVSISVFDTEDAAEESNQRAAEWVGNHPGLIPAAKSMEQGLVVTSG